MRARLEATAQGGGKAVLGAARRRRAGKAAGAARGRHEGDAEWAERGKLEEAEEAGAAAHGPGGGQGRVRGARRRNG